MRTSAARVVVGVPDQKLTASAPSSVAIVDGRVQEIEALLPLLRPAADQRRLMLVPRIEKEAGAGFDDAAQVEPLEQAADPATRLLQVRFGTD